MSKHVVYVGSYTDTNTCQGLTLFDVDAENNTLKKRCEYPVSNAAYISVSHDKRFLYATTDLGVVSFKILPDGSLEHLNTAPIQGMRGGHLSMTRANTYLFVSGFYDGKITVLRLNPDGSVGEVTHGIFHKGPGSVAERNYQPHVRCARLTPDERFLFVVDSGIDQARIYRFDHEKGTLYDVDSLHCRLQAGPRFIRFSKDGRFFYSIKELINTISIYEFHPGNKAPEYHLLGSVSTLGEKYSDFSAAVSFRLTEDEKYLFCTNAGDNSVGIFRRDPDTGMLTQLNVLPISGNYPTSVNIFPDGKHIFCTNVDSNSITSFTVDYEKGLLIMHGTPIDIPQPKSAVIVELPEE